MFIPIKVTHLQEYGLKRFWKQQLARGMGISATKKKRNQRLETKLELLLKILLSPLVFFKFSIADKFRFKFAVLDTAAFVARQVGKFSFPVSY